MKTRRGAAAGVLALWLGVAGAQAQGSAGTGNSGAGTAASDPGGDAAMKHDAGVPLPGGGNTRDLTMPGEGGVADTGLGGSTNGTGNGAVSGKPSAKTGAAGVPGTGMSVDQPAGQGIGGQGVSNGVTAGGTSEAGSGTGSSGAGTGPSGATGH